MGSGTLRSAWGRTGREKARKAVLYTGAVGRAFASERDAGKPQARARLVLSRLASVRERRHEDELLRAHILERAGGAVVAHVQIVQPELLARGGVVKELRVDSENALPFGDIAQRRTAGEDRR